MRKRYFEIYNNVLGGVINCLSYNFDHCNNQTAYQINISMSSEVITFVSIRLSESSRLGNLADAISC